MRKIDIVGIAFGNFRRRKMRSVLTVLGVVIGTASIVTMMSLGIALDQSFSASMKDMGGLTTIQVYPGYDDTTGRQKGNLDDKLVKELEAIPKVAAVSPELSLNGKIMAGRYQWGANIMGIDMSLAKYYNFTYDKGTGFTDETISSGKNIYVAFGSETPYQFRIPQKGGHGGMMGGMMMSYGDGGSESRPAPDVDLMSTDTRLRYTFDYNYGQSRPGDASVKKKAPLYKVIPVGILKENNDSDYNAYVDIETAKKVREDQKKFEKSQSSSSQSSKKTALAYDNIKVFTETMEDTTAIAEAIKKMGYQAWSSGDMISSMKKQMGFIQLLLGGIGSISLIVAAIGITNTMVMSIYERTREIGIMKVIGCYLKDIRTMFLVEASFIGLFGGVVGITLSYSLSYVMNFLVARGGASEMGGMMMGMGGGASTVISVIPPWLALTAIIFATIIALVSGFLPARRAMKLSALEAMKV